MSEKETDEIINQIRGIIKDQEAEIQQHKDIANELVIQRNQAIEKVEAAKTRCHEIIEKLEATDRTAYGKTAALEILAVLDSEQNSGETTK